MNQTPDQNDSIKEEHERRFVPDLDALPFDYFKYLPGASYITQGYLEDKQRTRVRCEYKDKNKTRDEESIYTLTIKSGEGVSRDEDEKEIPKEEFEHLWNSVKCSLKKVRYFINWDGVDAQLNIFHHELGGYVQFEVEFKTHEEAMAFIPPVWLGREVTDDKKHGNYSLAKFGKPND